MRQDEATLRDISKSARLIAKFIAGITEEQFLEDDKTQSSVLYQLLVIGEAVKRLSSELRARHDDIPWILIAGMRDQLIHAYDTVDWEEVWKTTTFDVPALAVAIETMLSPNS